MAIGALFDQSGRIRGMIDMLAGARLAKLVSWLLVVAIAASLAYWTWRLLPLSATGHQDAGLQTMHDEDPVAALRTQNWFVPMGQGNPAVADVSSRYELRWVYSGRPGVCILRLPGLQDKAFRVGEEIENGIKLKEVGDREVVIEGSFGTERLRMPELQDTSIPSGSPPPPVPPAPAMTAEEGTPQVTTPADANSPADVPTVPPGQDK